ncbi:xylose isomerase domain-containing protein [Paenibacillus mucilaginosus 3016]|uniref:Xylose isomerase domain-containing protein n=2 Tax=Paenibacillus mucilaginosus TaxID=61624 RepID=H6NM86_9BACL|nr:TIM barrel protein [Paenibacillus mucilaginosus]AFC33248.1 xylose isomerase domain-containing protein [Paenibacillus mucilaginosus 3016]AFH65561.1 xylose isomerase [Paenibacillus mucilaginosus K02]WFA21674.1 sugar phosphate isomerase/epimerase [Paenibacillus mucilaginosus]
MSYLSVSTWSLHRLLGPLRWTQWDAETGTHVTLEQEQPEVLSLLELPREAAGRGYAALEVCHFHFPATDPAYLGRLREAFAAAGISFDTLLLDYGDLTSGDERRRAADVEFIRRWIGYASLAGAKQIRVVAGEAQPDDEEALRLSAGTLASLAAYASEHGVRVVTENFKPLTSTADSCLKLRSLAGEQVGFITDFGNFKSPAKYEELAAAIPGSVSVHAKANYDENGFPDEEEYLRCLEQVRAAGYNGAVVLIYDGPGDMWEGLERIRKIVEPYL